MFDTIFCRAKLPGTPPAFVVEKPSFQTKDLDCVMNCYEITEAGQLMLTRRGFGREPEKPELTNVTATINFYISNFAASSFGYIFTVEGEDYEYIEYAATFTAGQLQGGIAEVKGERKPALPRSALRPLNLSPTAEQVAAHKAKREANYLGRTMYRRCYAGVLKQSSAANNWEAVPVTAVPVTVVAETATQRCLLDSDGQLGVVNNSLCDLYESAEAAFNAERDRIAVRKAEKAHYDALWKERTGQDPPESTIFV